MATSAQDFNAKLRLEHDLATQLLVFNRELIQKTVRTHSLGGTFSASTKQPELTQILRSHYDKVGGIFDHDIRDDLSDDVLSTDAEDEAIAGALALFFTTRAATNSQIITDTNQRDITESANLALQAAQEDAPAGTRVTPIEVAFITGAILNRKLNGRVTAIANTETQAPAEASKLTEAEVLSGQPTSVSGGGIEAPVEAPTPTKEWETRGDELVRTSPFSHQAADGQKVEIDGVFIVGGQSMRYPGDPSLGASVANIINCRCRQKFNTAEIEAVRRERVELAAPVALEA